MIMLPNVNETRQIGGARWRKAVARRCRTPTRSGPPTHGPLLREEPKEHYPITTLFALSFQNITLPYLHYVLHYVLKHYSRKGVLLYRLVITKEYDQKKTYSSETYRNVGHLRTSCNTRISEILCINDREGGTSDSGQERCRQTCTDRHLGRRGQRRAGIQYHHQTHQTGTAPSLLHTRPPPRQKPSFLRLLSPLSRL